MSNLLPLLIFAPLLSALVAFLLPRQAARLTIVTFLLGLGLTVHLLWHLSAGDRLMHVLGGWQPGLAIHLQLDMLSALFIGMTYTIGLAIAVYATHYFEHARGSLFWPLTLLLLSALVALFLSADLFNIYVTLELIGLSAVALVTLGNNPTAVRAAARYLVIGLLGSLAVLAAIGLIYRRYGVLDINLLAPIITGDLATWTALTLLTGGLLIKTALFPFHFWLPPAHANAPAPVSALLSALVVKAGLYLLMQFWLLSFATIITPQAALVLGLLGAGAVLWGSWQAIIAERLKQLAACSTVAQIGYLFLFFPLLSALPADDKRDTALAALMVMLLTHAFAKSGLFMAIGIIQQQAGHDRISELGGTARTLPVTTFTLALAGVALIGLPPSGSFLGKWQLISYSLQLQHWPWIVIVALGTLMAAAYVFRVLGHAFEPRESNVRGFLDATEELPALVMAIVATGVLGLAANGIWQQLSFTALTRGMAG